MARIAGTNIPTEKRLEIALTYIYGIGLKTSQNLLKNLNIDPNQRVKDTSEADLAKIREYIEKNLTVEADLSRIVRDRKSTRLNSSHSQQSRMPSSA